MFVLFLLRKKYDFIFNKSVVGNKLNPNPKVVMTFLGILLSNTLKFY